MKRIFLILVLLSICQLNAWPKVDRKTFIADTLKVALPVDSCLGAGQSGLRFSDQRDYPADLVLIRQIDKWGYIPVDQYVVLNQPLTQTLERYASRDSIRHRGSLTLHHLFIWRDTKPALKKGNQLNAYTVLLDSMDRPIGDRIWELTRKPAKKQKYGDQMSQLLDDWFRAQVGAVKDYRYHSDLYPYRFRRQLIPWSDLIVLPDGYAVIAHLSLDYPADQMSAYTRGSAGIYYRKSSRLESIAIGGQDQQWYYRLNRRLLGRVNPSLRIGFNNFNRRYFNHLDIWNLLMVNLTLITSVEYRPVYSKGPWLGMGLFQNIIILPDVIPRYEPGLAITLGWILP